MHLFETPPAINHPVNNFTSGNYWGGGSEFEFGNRFIDAYKEQISKIHCKSIFENLTLMREVKVSGCGISDLVTISNRTPNENNGKLIVRTFEFKLNDWRKGIMQAVRFKNYSHVSILVIPLAKTKAAVDYLNLFEQLKIGLWGFDSDLKNIKPIYTPRRSKALDARKLSYIINQAELFSYTV
jgi:hypothetical protein